MFKRTILYLKSKSVPLSSVLHKDKNNFNLLRLIAAAAVIFGHSFALFKSEYKEPVADFLGFTYIGDLSVYFFFFLSGILVTASFFNTKSVLHFINKRVVRIWPGMLVCVFITAFIIGPIFSDLHFKDYFSSTVPVKYFLSNLVMNTGVWFLPGVFANNFLKNFVNGSLWTLSSEVRCYIFVLLIGILQRFTKKPVFVFATIIIFIFSFTKIGYLSYLFGKDSPWFVLFFMAGINAYLFRQKIFINVYAAVFFILVWLLFCSQNNELSHLLFYIAFIYCAMLLGKSKPLLKLKLTEDYSYGVYIYGFVIQQCIAASFPQLAAYTSMLIVFPIVIIVAMLSWHLIEKPALKWYQKKH